MNLTQHCKTHAILKTDSKTIISQAVSSDHSLTEGEKKPQSSSSLQVREKSALHCSAGH